MLYKVVVQTVLLYGSKSCVITEEMMNVLDAFAIGSQVGSWGIHLSA